MIAQDDYVLDESGVTMHSRLIVNPSTQLIVLIHGLFNDVNAWRDLVITGEMHELSFLLIDLPGHGESSTSSDYSFTNTSEIINRHVSGILKRSEVKFEDVWIGGLSLGGMIALECVKSDKELYQGAFIISPVIGDRLKGFFYGTLIKRLMEYTLHSRLVQIIVTAIIKSEIYNYISWKNNTVNMKLRAYRRLTGQGNLSWTINAVARYILQCLSYDTVLEIDQLRTYSKVILTVGRKDRFITDWEYYDDLIRRWRPTVSSEVLEGLGHTLLYEAPELIIQTVVNHIRRTEQVGDRADE